MPGDPASVALGPAPRTYVSKTDAWLWIGISAALMMLRVYPAFIPHVGNDSFQYLSMAGEALAGRFGYTTLVHFDAERSFGVIPAPMVTFPMGYPALVALTSLIGVPLREAALLVSALATLSCVPLLAWICNRFDMPRGPGNAVLALFVFNATALEFSVSATTEALFTSVVLLGVTCIVRARSASGRRAWWLWAMAGLAFGAAYHVRYAGLFFVVGLAALAAWHLLRSARPVAQGYAIAFAAACTLVAFGVARNISLVGHWRGGNEKAVFNSVPLLLRYTAGAVNRLVLGDYPLSLSNIAARAVFAVLLATGTAVLGRAYFRARATRAGRPRVLESVASDVAVLVLVYIACMVYAGLTTVITYGARMFVPVVPLILVLGGVCLRKSLETVPEGDSTRRLALRALAVGFCLYVILNLVILREPPPSNVPPGTEAIDAPSVDGKSARAAVRELAGETGVVVANHGQALGYVLGRPTVSLAGPQYSRVEWREDTLRETIARFGAAAVVIYVPTGDERTSTDFVPSAFVERLIEGQAPNWMDLVYRNGGVLVYASHPDR